VVSQKEVTVRATADWVDTGLKLSAGQHLWITTRADGQWSGNPQYFGYSDANGSSQYPGGFRVDANANVLSLIGFIGANPPPPQDQSISAGASNGGPGGTTDPGFIEPGNTVKNYVPKSQTGEMWLRNNDNTNSISDTGQQIADIYITS
jgi:hypothetical protein